MTALTNLKREYIAVDTELPRRRLENGETLYQLYWLDNPYRHVGGVMSYYDSAEGRRAHAVFLFDPDADGWYALKDYDFLDGPYEFEQLLTILALEGFTHVY